MSLESFKNLTNYPGRELLDHIKREAIEVIEHCENYTIFFSNTDKLKLSDGEL